MLIAVHSRLSSIVAMVTVFQTPSPILTREFVFEQAPFSSCHASTIEESHGTLVAAWFGGSYEGADDVGIWFSRRENGGWTPPKEIAEGRGDDNEPLPCYNPVLFQTKGPLLLFYKVGPNPAGWWGMMMRSTDGGQNWSQPERLPKGILGPIKNKPVQLADGDLLCPSSDESHGWTVHFERTSDFGKTWSRSAVVGRTQGRNVVEAIQPTILVHDGVHLQALARTKQGWIYTTRSHDGGANWSPLKRTHLPNPNSGIDAVTLRDGRSLLIYNDTAQGRSPLNAAILTPDGEGVESSITLESDPGKEFSYPAVIQTADGHVHITYTWHRKRIVHVEIDPGSMR